MASDELAGGQVVTKTSGDALGREALGREVTLLAAGHPAFPSLLDVDGDLDRPAAIALEHIAGQPIAEAAKNDPAWVTAALADVLAGLEHLHARGLVHGDLKPPHMMVDESGRGRLIDLGLAVPIGSAVRGGTLRYLPPEVREGARASVAGDLYSFGRALLDEEGSLDARTGALVRACVAARPEDRPASALACIVALGETRRRLIVNGGFARVGDERALDEATKTLLEPASALFVDAPRGSGRRRFVRDLRMRALLRGRSCAVIGADADPAWRARLARALDADAGVILLVEELDVSVVAEQSRAAVVVVGPVPRSSSATRHVALPRATPSDVMSLFEDAAVRIEPALAERARVLADGRMGVLAGLARGAVTTPLGDEAAIGAAIDRLDRRSTVDEPSAPSAMDLASRGSFREAVAALESAPGTSELDELLLIQCHERLGSFEAAARGAQALAQSRTPSIALAAHAVAAHVELSLGNVARASEHAAAGLRLATSVEASSAPPLGLVKGVVPLVGRLYAVRSDAALRAGDTKAALSFADAAASYARQHGNEWLLAQSLSRTAAAHALGGDPQRAKASHALALSHAERAGDIGALPPFIMNLATAEHALGEVDQAIEHYQEAAALAAKLGRQSNRLAALTNLAGLWLFVGATAEARNLLDEADALAEKTGDAMYRAQLLLLRAELSRDSDVVRALELAREAQEAFARVSAERQALEAELLLSELGAVAGSSERAISFVSNRSEELAAAGLGPRASLLAARAHARLGRHQDAADHSKSAVEGANATGDSELAARASFELASALESLAEGSGDLWFDRAKESLGRAAGAMSSSVRARFLAAAERARLMAPRSASRSVSPAGLGNETRRLLALVRRLLQEGKRSDVLEATVDEAVALTGAERALLLLAEPKGKATVAVARNVDPRALRGEKFRFSRSVAERVIKSGEPLVTASAPDDPELGSARSILDLGLRSILCVPIRGPERTLGALYLDHRLERGRFAEAERELTVALADIAGIALEKARLLGEAELRAEELARDNAAIALESERRAREVERLARELSEGARAAPEQAGIVGRSHKLRQALDVARRVAPSDLPVLVRGESGTGKELFARFVHGESARARGPFVAINCGAVPETLLESELFGHRRGAFTGATSDHPGLFLQADGGTLLLDEIGEMPLRMQTRLLRVLQEKEVRPIGGTKDVKVDVRIVAATHRDLEQATAAGTFREDLYYRLLGARVVLPALRERREDILDIAYAILRRLGDRRQKRYELTRAAETALLRHDWPGNVRELEQTLTRGALLSDGSLIDQDVLDLERAPVSRKTAVASFDRQLLEKALAAAGQNRSAAARALGVSRVTLHRWMKRYAIE